MTAINRIGVSIADLYGKGELPANISHDAFCKLHSSAHI
jgi:hypothetical protein